MILDAVTLVKGDREDPGYWWWCPGCAGVNGHGLHVFDERWEFDGNMTAPTFTGSYLSRGGPPDKPTVCHSFVRAGMIEYLPDCTHELAGQTVPMVDIPEGWLS